MSGQTKQTKIQVGDFVRPEDDVLKTQTAFGRERLPGARPPRSCLEEPLPLLIKASVSTLFSRKPFSALSGGSPVCSPSRL